MNMTNGKFFVEYPFYGKVVVGILLVFGTISFMNIKKSSFPMIEANTLRIIVKYPEATPQEMDEGVTSLIENSIRGVPGIKEFTSQSRENLSQITIISTFGYDIDELLIDVKNQVDGISNFPAEAEKPVVSKVRSRDRAMYLALISEDEERLKINDMVNRIEDDLLGSGEISQVSLEGLPSNRMELTVTIDETQLRRYNLNFSDIQQAIKSNNLDIHGGTIRSPREQIKVVSRQRSVQMENMLIHTPQGNYPLSTVADMSMGRSLSMINGYNGKRVIRVDAFMKNERASISPIISNVEDNILPGIMKKYPAITYTHMGQKKDTQEQIESLFKYFGVALIIIALIIIIYFKSFRQGIIILLSIPLGILGAIWGHSIHSEPLCMFSIWGLVALTGVIINDSVIFVSKYNQLLVKGYKVFEAAMETARSRFRPIFLTTVTTTAGLMPLVLESSPEARFLSPMAISVAYGILFGGFFILLTLPIQILVSNTLLVTTKKWFSKEEFTPESVEIAVINHQIDQKLEKDIRREEEKER